MSNTNLIFAGIGLINLLSIYLLIKLLGTKTALWKTLLAALVIVLSFIPFMGIPGAVAAIPAEVWATLLLGESVTEVFSGDKAWPAAIFTTAIMGVGLIPAITLSYYLAKHRSRRYWNVVFFTSFAFWSSWCPIIVIYMHR